MHTVTGVFWRANNCFICSGGVPSVGSFLNSSGWVELRRWFSKQLLNCQTLKIISDEMLKLTSLYAVTTHGRCHCFNVVVGLVWSNDYGSCAGRSIAIGRAFSAKQVTIWWRRQKGVPWFFRLGLGVGLKHKSMKNMFYWGASKKRIKCKRGQ